MGEKKSKIHTEAAFERLLVQGTYWKRGIWHCDPCLPSMLSSSPLCDTNVLRSKVSNAVLAEMRSIQPGTHVHRQRNRLLCDLIHTGWCKRGRVAWAGGAPAWEDVTWSRHSQASHSSSSNCRWQKEQKSNILGRQLQKNQRQVLGNTKAGLKSCELTSR